MQDLWSHVRSQVIGRGAPMRSPLGERRITYADFTASGRGVASVERYLLRVLESYGNTHTEDDYTGGLTSQHLLRAERCIKAAVHADERYRIIGCGYGTTGAVHRLQQILGVYIPPVTRETLKDSYEGYFSAGELPRFRKHIDEGRPVVFVGPYEHHSNEVSWRECLAEVVEVDLDGEGSLDLQDLRAKLSAPRYAGRRKIGAFSAASNVTGLKTPVYEGARLLHEHEALAFFDFAAMAPYSRIDVCRDPQSFFDGIYFSPHKFLGGPGAAGILVIHERVYRAALPPTCGAGGTVDFVSADEQEYNPDIETREKPGTPGILQVVRAALVMQLQELLGVERIEARDRELIGRALGRFRAHPDIEVLGNPDPERRVAICSFNIRAGDAYLHPRFVVRLLNDLFGIQSRAGCSCAGPYGHRLLKIDRERSHLYKEKILHGDAGIKPGWCRVGFHYLLTDEEFDFICDAVEFVAEHGRVFLPLYRFDLHTGAWRHRDGEPECRQPQLREWIEAEMRGQGPEADGGSLSEAYRVYMSQAREMARELRRSFRPERLKSTERDLIAFVYWE